MPGQPQDRTQPYHRIYVWWQSMMGRLGSDRDRVKVACVTTVMIKACRGGDWVLFGSLRQFAETLPDYPDWRACERDAALVESVRDRLRAGLRSAGWV